MLGKTYWWQYVTSFVCMVSVSLSKGPIFLVKRCSVVKACVTLQIEIKRRRVQVLDLISAGTLRDPRGKISEISAALVCVLVRKTNMVKLCYTQLKSLHFASQRKQCSREEQGKYVLSETAEHKYTEIQWKIQFLLNTLNLKVQVIDALIAQLSMCPFLPLQVGGSSQCGVNGEWAFCVSMWDRGEIGKQE